jgi:hypothetical protein
MFPPGRFYLALGEDVRKRQVGGDRRFSGLRGKENASASRLDAVRFLAREEKHHDGGSVGCACYLVVT